MKTGKYLQAHTVPLSPQALALLPMLRELSGHTERLATRRSVYFAITSFSQDLPVSRQSHRRCKKKPSLARPCANLWSISGPAAWRQAFIYRTFIGQTADPRSYQLLDEWRRILDQREWRLAVAPDERGNQLRQASPLAMLLPEKKRLGIIRRVKALKQGAHATAPA